MPTPFRIPFASLWVGCARSWRYRHDRRELAGLDGRLPEDVGLLRGDPARGVPPAWPVSCPRREDTFRRRGSLSVRGWTFKLYAPAGDQAGLRREDEARAARAIGAALAGPNPAPVAGFAILRPGVHGGLGLASWWWADRSLHCDRMEIPSAGRPTHPQDPTLDVAEIGLLDRECAAWRRHVLEASRPDLGAYMGEDCA